MGLRPYRRKPADMQAKRIVQVVDRAAGAEHRAAPDAARAEPGVEVSEEEKVA